MLYPPKPHPKAENGAPSGPYSLFVLGFFWHQMPQQQRQDDGHNDVHRKVASTLDLAGFFWAEVVKFVYVHK